MTDHDSATDEWRINRRSALKGAGMTGIGILGGSAITGSATARGPGGAGPPGKSCEECPDGMEFLAKYKFECIETECIEEDTETGECLKYECVDWDFVLEKGDDLVEITYDAFDDTYNKEGEIAEPNFIEFEAEGYVIQHVCVYGGRDNDYGEDDGGLTEFASDLTNPGGQEAAISNVVFCGIEDEVVPFACPFYGTSRSDPTAIFSIKADPETGEIVETQIGEIPDESADSNYPNGVAFDPDNDRWYFAEDTGELKTMTYDPGDGEYNIDTYGIVTPGGEPIAGAAFWNDQNEYLFIPNGTNLLKAAEINGGSVNIRTVTNLEWSNIGLGDLAIDRENEILYVSTTRTNESGMNFFSVDLNYLSDQNEIVASNDRTSFAVGAQIAFDDAGNLWAHNAGTGDWRIVENLGDGSLSDVIATTREYTDLAQCGFYTGNDPAL